MPPETATSIAIVVNGKPTVCGAAAKVSDLLAELKLAPIRVAVEINEELVPRKAFAQTTLHEGDRVEIVTFVGGG